MNIKRRKAIDAIAAKLADIAAEIEDIESEEQDYYDNMPESIQPGEKGERAQAAIDALTEACGLIGEAKSNLEGIE